MRIPDQHIRDVLRLYAQRARGAAAPMANQPDSEGKRPEAPRGDVVALSPEAQEFTRLRDLVAQVPEVRRERVEAIARAIRDGTYHVDAKDVAEKLLRRLEGEDVI